MKTSEEREGRSQKLLTSSSSREWKKIEDRKEGLSSVHLSSAASLSTLSQQSLMLYTNSLSLPKHSPVGSSTEEEEEDHLEYATRGISELSKLLGTDNGLESPASDNSNNNSLYKMWNPDDLLVNPLQQHRLSPPPSLSSTSLQTSLSDSAVASPVSCGHKTLAGFPEEIVLFNRTSLSACTHTNNIANQ